MAITEEQRARRKSGIYASDVAAIMTGNGVRVALEKMGELEAENLDDVPNVQLGNILEAPVLDAYESATGYTLIRSPDTMTHPMHKWLGCHLDAHAPDAGRVVEAKAFSVFSRGEWGEPGTDEVPAARLWQCMAQMAITGASLADIPICFVNEKALVQFLTSGTVPIEIYTIPSNADLIDYMIDECAKVWRCVETGNLPEPVNVGDAELIYRRSKEGAVAEADEKIFQLYEALGGARAALKAAEDDKASIESRIKAFMADASELRFQGRTLATWRSNKDGEQFDKDAFKKAYPEIYKQFAKPKAGARPFLFKE